jgi:hypothetical protein
MLETVIIPIVVVVILLGSFLFAKHMDTIRMQAWQDKKIVIMKWVKYSRIKNGNAPFISTIEDLNEAEQDLRKTAAWYNKKYKLYGYCCPPELLFDLEGDL